MSNIKESLQKVKWDSILIAVITIALGIVCIAVPYSAASALSIILGSCLIVMGAIMIAKCLYIRPIVFSSYFVVAILFVVLGIFCIVERGLVAQIMSIIFGLFMVIDSIDSLSESILMCKAHISGWWIMLAASCVTIVLGFVMMFTDPSTMMLYVGICLMIEGIRRLVVTLVFAQKVKEAKKVLEPQELSKDDYHVDGE